MLMMMTMMTIDLYSTQYPCTSPSHAAIKVAKRHCKKGESKGNRERERENKETKKIEGSSWCTSSALN